jgi:hypothetical protein
MAAVTNKINKKVVSMKKDKDVGTSRRNCRDATSEEEEDPSNPYVSDYMPEIEGESNVAQQEFMLDNDEVMNQGGNLAYMINYTILI